MTNFNPTPPHSSKAWAASLNQMVQDMWIRYRLGIKLPVIFFYLNWTAKICRFGKLSIPDLFLILYLFLDLKKEIIQYSITHIEQHIISWFAFQDIPY
jgi:hypothetical protein